MKQAERDDAGKRVDGPTSAEREELEGLRRENHRLRQERAGHITRRLRAVTLTQSSCHYQENLDLIARKQEGGPKPPLRLRVAAYAAWMAQAGRWRLSSRFAAVVAAGPLGPLRRAAVSLAFGASIIEATPSAMLNGPPLFDSPTLRQIKVT